MKSPTAIVTFLLALGVGLAAEDPIAAVVAENHGEVIFVRQENSGSLNILLSTIRCDDWPRVVLAGGEAGGVYIKEGEHRFQAFSAAPWEPESSTTECKSEVLRLGVKKGAKIFIEIVPVVPDEKSKIKFHWTLREKKG